LANARNADERGDVAVAAELGEAPAPLERFGDPFHYVLARGIQCRAALEIRRRIPVEPQVLPVHPAHIEAALKGRCRQRVAGVTPTTWRRHRPVSALRAVAAADIEIRSPGWIEPGQDLGAEVGDEARELS
jgi:hypothetical protein